MTLISLPRAPTFNLGGKRALVTGAGRGIGLGAAAALAQAGAHVTLCARSPEELDALRDAIRRDGGGAETLTLDITDVASTMAALESCPPIANRCAMALKPRPATCGKTNHIQWLRLRPRDSSSTTCG